MPSLNLSDLTINLFRLTMEESRVWTTSLIALCKHREQGLRVETICGNITPLSIPYRLGNSTTRNIRHAVLLTG